MKVKKKLSKTVFSRAPVRICDIGGWTDTWFYPNGAVFNFCVDLYNYVMIKECNTNLIRIHSENLNLTTQMNGFEDIKYNGELDLLKAIIKRMKIKGGIDRENGRTRVDGVDAIGGITRVGHHDIIIAVEVLASEGRCSNSIHGQNVLGNKEVAGGIAS